MDMYVYGCDRTEEFHACISSLHHLAVTGRLWLDPPRNKASKTINTSPKNSAKFLSDCENIRTALKTSRMKLTNLEILLLENKNQSTDVCKQLIDVLQADLVNLNKSKVVLQSFVSVLQSNSGLSLQHMKHLNLIVGGVEYHLAQMMSEFQTLLNEHRHDLSARCGQSNVKQTPTVDFIEPTVNSVDAVIRPTSVQTNGKTVSTFNDRVVQPSATFHLPTEYTNQSTDQLQIYASPQFDHEVRQRDISIRHVESTIVKLGEIYQQFSSLVQEQSDTVLRIDSYTDDFELNVTDAHAHLTLFLRRISNNRSLLLKVFATILICFSLFVWLNR